MGIFNYSMCETSLQLILSHVIIMTHQQYLTYFNIRTTITNVERGLLQPVAVLSLNTGWVGGELEGFWLAGSDTQTELAAKACT